MDSSTCLAAAIADGFEAHALAVDYGQRHRGEIEAARAVAEALGARSFRVVRADLAVLGGSVLTGSGEVPKDRPLEEIGRGIPSTYVPGRNTVFLALALSAAESLEAEAVYIGVNSLDYSGYPDCRPEFLAAFREAARLGTRRGVEGRPIEIHAPLLQSGKGDIVRMGASLGVPFEKTLSCYDPVAGPEGWTHCRRCDACLLRARGFRDAGREDPAP
jgi:7-cyano-7-deazaguanine synthase